MIGLQATIDKLRRTLAPASAADVLGAIYGAKLLSWLAPSLVEVRVRLKDKGELIWAGAWLGSREVRFAVGRGVPDQALRYLDRGASAALLLNPDQFVETCGELPRSATKRLRATMGHVLPAWTPFRSDELLFAAKATGGGGDGVRVNVRYVLRSRMPRVITSPRGSMQPFVRLLFGPGWAASSGAHTSPKAFALRAYETCCLVLPLVLLPSLLLVDGQRILDKRTRASDELATAVTVQKAADRARHELEVLQKSLNAAASGAPADYPGSVLSHLDATLPPQARVKQLQLDREGGRAVLWDPWNGEPAASHGSWTLHKISPTELVVQRNSEL